MHGKATPRPWEARTRVRACAPRREVEPYPHTVPRYDLAMALPCVVTKRRGRDIAFTLWPSPLRHSLEHARGACHTHTGTHTHTHTRPPGARAAPDLVATPDPVGDQHAGPAYRGEAWGAAPWARFFTERGGGRVMGRGPACQAEPAYTPSQPKDLAGLPTVGR
jgi:hypothetical protein